MNNSRMKMAISQMRGENMDPMHGLILQQIKLAVEQQVQKELEYLMQDIVGGLSDELENLVSASVDQKIGDKLKGDKGDTGNDGVDGKDGLDGRDGQDGMNGKDGETPDINEIAARVRFALPSKEDIISSVLKRIPKPMDGVNGRDGSPDSPEDIAAKVNKLSDIIDMNSIRGLKNALNDLQKNIRSMKVEATKLVSGGGDSVQYTDLSASLDGATKTFTMPAHRKIIQVIGSSAPFVFRPDTDYTRTRTTITFDSAIDAASALATGQSLIVTYTR